MNNGWIKINRRILGWRWYSSSEMVHLFLHFILKASTEDKPWKNIIVRRGQLVTSVAHLSDELDMSVQKIRTCLERLKSTNEITIKTTNKFSIITVCNYELYQDLTTDEQQTKQQATQQTNNKRTTTSKELKNNKNNIIDNINCANGDFSKLEAEFEEFRKAYPGRKRGHDTEFEAFKRKHKNWAEIVPLLMPALQRLIAYREAAQKAGQWSANFANLSTWLFQSRWEEELPEIKTATSTTATTQPKTVSVEDYEDELPEAFRSKNK